MNKKAHSLRTIAVHGTQPADLAYGAITTPIYATSTFVQKSPGVHQGYEYSRSKNPTRSSLENTIASLEGGYAGFAFSSGLAATATVLSLLGKDAHMIVSSDLYGGTYRLFEQVKKHNDGLATTYVDFKNPIHIKNAIRENTKAIWVETPGNPLLSIVDLKTVANIAKEYNLIAFCDNTFATPYLQRPLEWGFHVVVHSATKYLNGHADVIAGLAVVDHEKRAEQIAFYQNAIGAVLSPFDAFLVQRGIKTLALRMDAHSNHALALAHFLQNHDDVERVYYPGLETHPGHEVAKKQMHTFGGMLAFSIKGNMKDAEAFVTSTKLFSLAESLGGVESLIEHPATMTHASIPRSIREKQGITDTLVRLSVGIEDIEDLRADLDRAFKHMKKEG